ncbi:TMEM175 family protein [Rhodanobacter sp. DHB23]|uniref:TMEM175 family protein n=1 Tax=Rhodanobacter sp. DHB23 TaxID=2775923 RepID=UPI00177D724A|nr:TMEM175 family protein [Rhodanobacter sp. DHB23]
MENMAPQPLREEHVRQRHLDRLVMMSDGVFAIAMTLSAVELRPELLPGKSLLETWATPLGIYFLSFTVIAGVWYAHRRTLAHLRDVDNVTTGLNLLLLSLVALMPVVVRFLLTDPSRRINNAGMIAYGVAMATTYGCLALTWGYPALYAGLAPHVSRRQAWGWLLEYLFVSVVFLAMALFGLRLVTLAVLVAAAGVVMRIASFWLGRTGKT